MKRENENLICKLAGDMKSSTHIDAQLFKDLGVKRGLRNEDGSGVLVGLTNIGNVVGYERDSKGVLKPVDGRLYFRGYEIKDLVHAFTHEDRFGFTETAFLLLSGRLPDAAELEQFKNLLKENMPIEQKTILHIIELEGFNIMNILSRTVLELYTFDKNPDDISPDNLMHQSIALIAKFPCIIAYAYNMLRRKYFGRTLHIRDPKPRLSVAENFLYMLNGPGYSHLDAKMLDLMLVLHSEHGGGNNSTFTVRVTSSTGTDTYSAIAAGIGSLKGPKHGGANLKVCDMMDYLRTRVSYKSSDAEIEAALSEILQGKAFDGMGLIYGIGHAVYTKSDPRTVLLKEMARDLAIEKGRSEDFEFMERVEKIAIATIYKAKGFDPERPGEPITVPSADPSHNAGAAMPATGINTGRFKPLCANVDFYSGFVYDLIGIPREIFTPLFAMARITGWCAHRNEELNSDAQRIIRPAYRCVTDARPYISINNR